MKFDKRLNIIDMRAIRTRIFEARKRLDMLRGLKVDTIETLAGIDTSLTKALDELNLAITQEEVE